MRSQSSLSRSWTTFVLGVSSALSCGRMPAMLQDPSTRISAREPGPTPQIHGATLVGFRAGTPFVHRAAATGSAPLAFEATGLPAGSSIDASTGIISGTVTAEGEYTVLLRVSNALGAAERELTMRVGDALALTPPMGWNSYDSFDDAVSESQFLEQAAWLRDNLQPFGWNTVVIDFRWYDPNAPDSDQSAENPQLRIDDNGRLQPAPNRFPSSAGGAGFRAIADQVHAWGLQFGIHIMRGIPRRAVSANLPIAGSAFTAADAVRASSDNGYTCVWNSDMFGVQGATPAGQAWYDSIFAQYAEWGVDFVKVDDATKNRPANLVEYHQSEVEAIQKAIHASGRSMVLSLSPGESLVSSASHLAGWANMWRMSDDFWDRWENLEHTFTLAARWEKFGGSAHWPDADMLPLGHLGPHCPVGGVDRETRFTENEQVLMMTLWAVLPSPYMLGANLVQSADDTFLMALLRNEEVLAVHQDALGAKARAVPRDASQAIWQRQLVNGSVAVGLFNRTSLDQTLSVSLGELGIAERSRVRDAWLRSDLPTVDPGGSLRVRVPGHAGALLVLSPERAP
jgi:alpha-galactosidase